MLKTTALVVALTLTTIASPAEAASHSWRIGNDVFHIYIDDLDLTTREGRALALGRVEKASARLCETEPVERDRKVCIAKTGSQVTARWIVLARLEHESANRALAAR